MYPDSTLSLFNDDFEFAVAYQWLIERLIELGLARPHPEVFPVWAYMYWINRAKPKPDLRYTALKRWGNSGRQVLLTLNIPEHRVLLSDFDQWFCCLCYTPAGSFRDAESFGGGAEAGPRPHDQPLPRALPSGIARQLAAGARPRRGQKAKPHLEGQSIHPGHLLGS